MDVTQTTAEGLKREFRVVVPAADLETRLNDRLVRLKDQVRLNGFRPGKVPVGHLRKLYGRAVMAEAIEELVRETNAKIVTDNGFKLAMDPQVKMPEDKTELEGVVEGKSDLSYTVALEVVPAIDLADFKGITLERLVAEVGSDEIQEALKRLADQNRPFTAKPEGAAAETGDRVTISFVGRIGGEPFEGGTGEDIPLTIGSGQFIPGFEDQLIGVKAGETRTVSVTFPENYLAEKLAGKAAEFEVTAKSVEAPGELTLDDDFAKKLGLESLAKLEEAIGERIKADFTAQSRQKLKRQLLDKLDTLHKFEPPPSLVEEEFKAVWETVLTDLKSQNRSFADEGTDEEKAKAEYRDIADRRVRLGLVLAEIGEKNGIKVTDDEISRAIVERARQYPGQEQQVWDFYRKNPGALASVRAPIFEEKVVDYILELATVTDRTVAKDELFKDDEAAAA
ncbi:trigger factor [Rhodoplanes sp. TEM]|uniref:Trigger factor n=1 Tax=Rhodoplanes tepidamans TaxID=200616 RepID=A0ABT5JHK3_RHOTP|nr:MULTISPECIES: trigger factor [Rhodoplanes]MDC7789193.1 trigger factor [Rhodoplanes tepidamans]MDC7984631.1 trigger factor [Rhodoplanes sp. TEM]MDQ0355560.1 trigger factor [Rhodoplanes tepidamans]